MYFLFNGLLILLYCLHWFWFYHIMSMAFKLVYYGNVVKDARSESEGSDAEDNVDNAAAAKDADKTATAVGEHASKINGHAPVNGVSKNLLSQQQQLQMQLSPEDNPKDK